MTQASLAAPTPVHTSQRRKAAIIVRLLLGSGAQLPLERLPAELQAALTAEMGGMRYIDGDTLRVVVGEFLTELERAGMVFPGGIDGALSLLDGHISEETAEDLRAKRAASQPVDPWPRIAGAEIDDLLPLIAAETAEVAAVILSKLPNARAAEILALLPGDQARRIALAVSRTGHVAPRFVTRIGRVLADQLSDTPETAFAQPAFERMGAILNVAPTATRDALLSGLQQGDAEFAGQVEKTIFTFAHIPQRLEARDVPAVARAVPADVMVTALAGAVGRQDAAGEFLLANLSRRMADALREEIAERGEVAERIAEEAMGRVVGAINDLVQSGAIVLAVEDEQAA